MSSVSQLDLFAPQVVAIVYGPFLSREQAMARGLSHYFTGLPCRNGHVSVRGVRKWNCLECDRRQKAAERVRDPERVRANERRMAAKHKESKSEQTRRWRQRNRARVQQYSVNFRIRYHSDPEFRARKQQYFNTYHMEQRAQKTPLAIRRALRCRAYGALTRQSATKAHAFNDLLGCTPAELRAHLENQFVDGMSWDNYGRDGWHVDHVRPCLSFDLTDPEQQRQCFHYSNLQPLWAADNIRKGARMPDSLPGNLRQCV